MFSVQKYLKIALMLILTGIVNNLHMLLQTILICNPVHAKISVHKGILLSLILKWYFIIFAKMPISEI